MTEDFRASYDAGRAYALSLGARDVFLKSLDLHQYPQWATAHFEQDTIRVSIAMTTYKGAIHAFVARTPVMNEHRIVDTDGWAVAYYRGVARASLVHVREESYPTTGACLRFSEWLQANLESFLMEDAL